MLIELRVENHRSLHSEQALTMLASLSERQDGQRARRVSGVREHVLPVVAIYGANASGKSNVLHAFETMQEAVTDSHRFWEVEGGTTYDPFAWGRSRQQPSLYEVSFVWGGTRYRYGFVMNEARFLEEWLFAGEPDEELACFERDADQLIIGELRAGLDGAKLVSQVMRSNSLFLSVGAQNNVPLLQEVYRWFSAATFLTAKRRENPYKLHKHHHKKLTELFSERAQLPLPGLEQPDASPSDRQLILSLLRAADLGITDVRVAPSSASSSSTEARVFLQHQHHDQDALLPLHQESHGTRTLLELGLVVLDCLKRGALLVVDELETSLHPKLMRALIDLFHHASTNPKLAQLIFTTHTTQLLSSRGDAPPLDIDQLWITRKLADGSTQLYPATDYEHTSHEDLESSYLHGRYGGIPSIITPLLTSHPHHDKTPSQ